MADSSTNSRYTDRVVDPRSSADALQEAKDSLTAAIGKANSKATPFFVPGETPVKTAAPIKTEMAAQGAPARVSLQPPSVPVSHISVTPQPAPGTGVDEFPDISLPTVKEQIVQTTTASAPSDKLRDLVPGIENTPRANASIDYVNTDVTEERISIPHPKSFNTKLWRLPEKPEPLTIVSVLTNHFKHMWTEWEPETIRQRVQELKLIPESLAGTIAEEVIYDGIFALQLVFSHTGVFDFWNMFEKVTQALNGNKVDMAIMQPPHPKDMVYAVRTIKLLRPDLVNDQPGEELGKYMAACSYKDGFLVVPGDIRQAQKHLNDLIQSNAYDDLANALWAAEARLYNMTDAEFDKTISQFEATEDTRAIQTVKNISVIQYIRDKGNVTQEQLR